MIVLVVLVAAEAEYSKGRQARTSITVVIDCAQGPRLEANHHHDRVYIPSFGQGGAVCMAAAVHLQDPVSSFR